MGHHNDHDDPDDPELFRRAVADARRLRHDRVAPRPPPPAPVPRQREADERRVMEELLDGELDPADVETGEELSFLRPGIQNRVLRRLRRGQYPVEAVLDLHGHTVPMARQALRDFVAEARHRRLRCVRIIHGKGRGSTNRGPVLKAAVDRWLRHWDPILAFASAQPRDGGTGAVYVLLRAG